MARLGVNIDHVATLRQARGGTDPDPLTAAILVELAGADGLVVHLREDRRHIQDRDLTMLREIVRTKLDLEMAADDAMAQADVLRTLTGGREEHLRSRRVAVLLQEVVFDLPGVVVSLFVEPSLDQIKAAHKIGAAYVELHTGRYSNAKRSKEEDEEFEAITQAAKLAYKLGLGVNAGHGLTYKNVKRLAKLPEIVEFNIGHSIIARSVMVGLVQAVREMRELIA